MAGALAVLAALAVLTALTPGAPAATLQVGPALSLPQALRQAVDGDEIDIPAGDYRGQVGVILQQRLTLRGVGGRPVLHADGRSAEGKAILVVRNGVVRIENLEFRGARVPDRNGAGIRFEGGRLEVLRCAFFDNENGILTAPGEQAELSVEDSEFGAAPAGTPLPHLIYVGRIGRFTLRGSQVGGGQQGHLVKSRALRNHILYNRLVDGPGGHAAYELEFPNGGLAWVVGNVIAQSAGTSNPAIVSFLAEGRSDEREQGLFMAHNTLVSESLTPALFVVVRDGARVVEKQFVNNLSVGLGLGELALADVTRGNFAIAGGLLRDPAAGDFGLGAHSLLRGRGVEPGMVHGESLRLAAEFMPPAGTRPLAPSAAPARWSPGAVQD
jgi:hypothetical protein